MLQALLAGLDPDADPSRNDAGLEDQLRLLVRLRKPHPKQVEFLESPAKRKVVKAGRRGGKTVGMSILAVDYMIRGWRVLYAAPTGNQLDTFWDECLNAVEPAIQAGLVYRNETRKLLRVLGGTGRIRAKTAWNADTLRGDYADLLIFDEYQLMNEDAWERVGAPMLLDNDGMVVFCFTPPSPFTRSVTKANDPMHANKLFKRASQDTSGRWAVFHFTSYDNPHLSVEALEDITRDMSRVAYESEILAEEHDEIPGALWTRETIEKTRVAPENVPDLIRVVIGVDPPGGATECGIVVAGVGRDHHFYVLADYSRAGSPAEWGAVVVEAFVNHMADVVVCETNFGGDMVSHVIELAANAQGQRVNYKNVQASRGKAIRAEPISALYERGQVHHVGVFEELENELCTWQPQVSGRPSPNRLDALVWALTEAQILPRARVQRAQVVGLYPSQQRKQRNGHEVTMARAISGKNGTRRRR